jgi:signal transduction histidine kinase/PAS domain-containing protein
VTFKEPSAPDDPLADQLLPDSVARSDQFLAARVSTAVGQSRDALPRNDGAARQDRPTPSRVDVTAFPGSAERSVLVRYGSAILFCVAALILTLVLAPYLQRSVFIFFWPAVIGTAMVGGVGPSLLASALSALLADYFLIAPLGSFNLTDPTDWVALLVLLITGVVVSSVMAKLRDARRRAEEVATQNATLAGEIESQAGELEHQLEESQSLHEELEHSAEELVEQTAEAEAAAKFSRGILESIVDPFVVEDADWRFRYINEAAAAVLRSRGRTNPQDLIGRVVWEEFPELVGTVFEREMRHAAEQRVPRTFDGFNPVRGEWYRLFCYPLPDGGLATQSRNIADQKRAEEASRYLASATETLSSSLDYETTLKELAQLVVPDFADWCAVDIVGEDGNVKQLAVAHADPDKVRLAYELNKRYPPDPNAPTGVYNVIRTGKPEFYSEIPEEMLVAGAVDDEHLKIIREVGIKSAMVVPLIARERTLGALTLVSAESGRRYTDADLQLALELARRAALAVDNARLHKAALDARSAAEAANLAKTQFLAVMSHELRTPLNAIAGYAELMRMGIRGPITPEQQADLDRIQRSQRNLLSLINDVLNYAKLEAGHVEFDTQTIAAHEFLYDIEALVTPQLQGKGLRYDYEKCDTSLTMRADLEKTRQIVLNLLSNAIKFTPSGGTITVECDATDHKIRIRVRDTGVGIPEEKIGAIFEPFIQLDRKLTSAQEGTGLGLAISRDLARGMGGDLSAESKVGEGSLFTLELPRA